MLKLDPESSPFISDLRVKLHDTQYEVFDDSSIRWEEISSPREAQRYNLWQLKFHYSKCNIWHGAIRSHRGSKLSLYTAKQEEHAVLVFVFLFICWLKRIKNASCKLLTFKYLTWKLICNFKGTLFSWVDNVFLFRHFCKDGLLLILLKKSWKTFKLYLKHLCWVLMH